MVAADVGRLVVVAADDPRHVLGMLTRGDVLAAHGRRIRAAEHRTRHINLRWRR
jgi:hypothetical protein